MPISKKRKNSKKKNRTPSSLKTQIRKDIETYKNLLINFKEKYFSLLGNDFKKDLYFLSSVLSDYNDLTFKHESNRISSVSFLNSLKSMYEGLRILYPEYFKKLEEVKSNDK